VAVIGIVLACAAASIQTVLYLTDVYVLDRSVAMFDVDEGAISTWSSSCATFAVGLVAFLLFFVDPKERVRGPALALTTAYLSFDDTATLHETIGYKVTGALNLSNSYAQVMWPLLYFPLLTIVALLMLRLGRDTPTAHRLIVAGLALLVTGVVMNMAGILLDLADVAKTSWLWTFEFTVEEGVELAGWILIASGASARLIALALDRQQPVVAPGRVSARLGVAAASEPQQR